MNILLTLLLVMLPAAVQAQEKPDYPAPTKSLKAEYTIYSGGLGDEQAPTKTERKLAIEVTGQGPRRSLIRFIRMPREFLAAARKVSGCAGRGMSGVRTRLRTATGASWGSIYGLGRVLLGGVADPLLAFSTLQS
jgi:hypothetical protein